MTSSTVLQLHQKVIFERNVMRAALFGALAGVAQFCLAGLGVRAIPLAFLAVVAAAGSTARGDKFDRMLVVGLSVLLPAVAFVVEVSDGWRFAMSGAVAGAVMVRAHLCERGDGQLGGARPGTVNHLLGAGLGAVMMIAGVHVAQVLAVRLSQLETPALFLAAGGGAVIALFVSLSSVAAHLALRPDPVEARCEELLPKLTGEFQPVGARALALYRQCGQAMAEMEREPAREELARTLGKMTKDAVELAADWAGVESQLEVNAARSLNEEVQSLEKSASESTDAMAKQQLEGAAASLREELLHLDELRVRRERILAKLKAQVALLERARVSLISMRSGQTQMKAAEITALSRKLSSLAAMQTDGARLADAVAVNAELSAQEAAKAVSDSIARNERGERRT